MLLCLANLIVVLESREERELKMNYKYLFFKDEKIPPTRLKAFPHSVFNFSYLSHLKGASEEVNR